MGIFDKVTGMFGKKKEASIATEPPDLEPLTPLTKDDTSVTPPTDTFKQQPISQPPRPMDPLTPPGVPETSREPQRQEIDASNIKAKLDLLLTYVESIQIQNRNMEERLKTIEKMLGQSRPIKYY